MLYNQALNRIDTIAAVQLGTVHDTISAVQSGTLQANPG
jgi:hypothetical protein